MSDEIRDEQAVLAALERAKADAKKYREELETVRAEVNTLRGQVDEQTSTIRDIRMRRAITEAGADPEKVMRYMVTDSISLTEDGLDGFDDELGRVRETLPELFDPKRQVGGQVEMNTNNEVNPVKSVSEMQADRLLGIH